MKILLTLSLLLTCMPLVATAQRAAPLPRAPIKEAERKLGELGYWTGPVDGILDRASRSALIAFQKWEGRAITAKLTADELEAIRISASPKARETGYQHVEVDVDRQLLMLVDRDGRLTVLPVSTGSETDFLEEGETSFAHTPRGRFVVYDKVDGWDGTPGGMYYSSYISGGVAIHGYPTVPNVPASHGCVRVPIFAAREVSKLMPVGTIVLVYDKISFVSAKAWVENPQLKQAALTASVASAVDDYNYQPENGKTAKPIVIKKARPRIIRAGLLN